MKIYYSLSSRVDTRGKSQIMMRCVASRNDIWRGKTKVYITPENWNDKTGEPRPRRDAQDKRECIDVRNRLYALTTAIIEKYNEDATHDKNWLVRVLENLKWNADGTINILSHTSLGNMSISASFKYMLQMSEADGVLVKSTCQQYNLTANKVEAYEKHRPCLVKEFDEDRFAELIHYIKNNYELSSNTLASVKTNLMRWWHWCRKQDKTLANIDGDMVVLRPRAYGTPYYLTQVERNKLYYAPMPRRMTENIRDMFVFQCLVGCRYSDLIRFTKENIQGDNLVYIAKKTIRSAPQTISVPLHPIAKEIIKKHEKSCRMQLFTERTTRAYNLQIRKAIVAADIDRMVTIRDKHTGEQVQKWLSEVASTHMARRTFIGCLYEQGFRESDICSMSGHKEGSMSIQRYRAVSDERKKKMIDSI